MKIDLDKIDKESFMVHESTVYGEPLYLVQPQHIGCKWTQENKIFRSSVWNAEGELVSAGFPKFPNWGEQPEVFPLPVSLKHCTCVEKLDGSLLIVSKYKGKLILRTRGTFDASVHDNGSELDLFKTKYLSLGYFTNGNMETWGASYLFEWTSPTQRIILGYGDQPDWTLVGIIDHGNYWLFPQHLLDETAEKIGIKRPARYTYDMIDEMIYKVGEWKGKEGIVIYSKGDQVLHKVKSTWYLALHKMKSEISNIENLVDVFLSWGMPEYQDFEKRLIETFDFELFTQIRGDVSRICDAKKNADETLFHMYGLAKSLRCIDRKTAALNVITKYGQTAKKGIMFNIIDNKVLDNKAWKTLIMQGL